MSSTHNIATQRLFAASATGRVASATCRPDVLSQYSQLTYDAIVPMMNEWEKSMPVVDEERTEEGIQEWWGQIEAEVVRDGSL